MVKDSNYIKFIDEALELTKEIPRYFSKFSNKIFCNHQKIVLLVLKQKLRTTYRDLVELLKISHIPLLIGLKRIPHHTTLVKFAKKIKPKLLNLLLPYRKAKIIALDGTGFEVGNKSIHYRLVTDQGKIYRRYVKLGISADTNKQIILKNTINKGPRNDNKDFMSLIKDIKTSCVTADKGYDADKHHSYVIRDLKAKSLICVRNNISRKSRNTLRKRVANNFDDKLYHQRSKVESIFSSLKRKYGSCLKARSFYAQKKEIICKLIAYNIDRKITLFYLFIIGFQQSPFF